MQPDQPDDHGRDVVEELGLAGTPEGEAMRSYFNFLEGAAEQALAQRDEAYDRGLAEGRQDVERLTLLLEQAEQYARDLQDGGIFLHDEAVATVRQEGLAEGRRQATEGWEREWSVRCLPDGFVLGQRFNEAGARARAEEIDGEPVSRLVGPWEPARAVVEQDEPEQSNDRLNRDLDALAVVGRMYLDALDADPENEMLTLPQAIRVTEVREAVERREAAWEPAEQPEAEDGHRD